MIDLEAEKQAHVLRAFLVGLQHQDEDEKTIASQLDELAELVSNLNMIPLAPEIVKVRSGAHIRYRIGSGKAEELAQLAQECEADVMVFDTDLTPSQQRNWERLFGGAVIGREEVILDIFAERYFRSNLPVWNILSPGSPASGAIFPVSEEAEFPTAVRVRRRSKPTAA